MMNLPDISRRLFVAGATWLAVDGLRKTVSAENTDEPFTIIVMDPLSAPLSCPCVKGYAQRDYEKLGKYLEPLLGRPVKVHFGESLIATLAKKSGGKADLIIGKESVVRLESREANLKAIPLASLTGKDGSTTMTGWVVVAASDPAISLVDLKEHQIIFGLPECDEKYKAPMNLFKELGLSVPVKPVTCNSCSDGATKILEMAKKGDKGATVISSYAAPLLEGCGTIQKGDLKVIGKTDPVPFVVAFANEKLPQETRDALVGFLTAVRKNPELLAALETKEGFLPFAALKKN